MLGDNRKLRAKLTERGQRADAKVLEVKERPWVERRPGEIGAYGIYRVKVLVSPSREAEFEAEFTDQWMDSGEPKIGMKVAVLYDPGHRSKVIFDKSPGRYQLMHPGDSMGPTDPLDDPEMAALLELDAVATDRPAGDPSPTRLDRLQQLADLHDRGALSDDEFAAEKARILGEA